MPSLIPWLIELPDGRYHWEPNERAPYKGPDRTCRSQRAAKKYPTKQAALDVAATIPGAKAVPYTNRW